MCFGQNNQYDEFSNLKNEVRINVAYAGFGYLEGTYERLLPKNTSAGVVFGKSIEEEIDLNYHIIAFYRLFFGQTKIEGSGFFIEADVALWKEDRRSNANTSNGAGLAVGGKFFRGNRFHGEVVLGVGRIITDNSDFQDSYPRITVSLGYRF